MSSVFPNHSAPDYAGQQGAALILALVVFSIVALLATSLGMDFFVSARRVENQLHSQQANAFMRGAEGIARKMLLDDFSISNTKDHRSDDKLQLGEEVQLPLDHGVIKGELCDMQGRLNVNNLSASAPAPGAPVVLSDDSERFIRLLQTLDLDPAISDIQAMEIANAVSDWIDADDIVSGAGGAEEGYYSQLDPPYRPANRPMASVSELRWVKGVTAELYKALEPHVTALDVGVGINVNTATPNVLRSIGEKGILTPLNSIEAGAITDDRDGTSSPADGFDQLADFVNSYRVHSTMNPATGNLSVRSDYFLLDTELFFMERFYRQYALLYRDPASGKSRTIARGSSDSGRCGLGD